MHDALVRHLILPLHERLLGRPTLRMLRALEESQWWPPDCLRDLQQQKLRRVLVVAARTPFYRRRLADAAIGPHEATLADLSRLSLLTKADIRENLPQMCDFTCRGGLHLASTGGSTGEPLQFFTDRARQAADQAARARSRRWFGVQPGQRELYLWGSPVEFAARDGLKALRDGLVNHRLLDAFDMTPTRMTRYFRVLETFDPVHLFGYPSSLARLVEFARANRLRPRARSLRAVFVTGELLAPADRDSIADFFQRPVADGYGAREAGFIAHECLHGRMHLTADSLIVELLDDHGRPVAPGQPGEVVVTHLDALGMPLLRYRTGDLARADDSPCPCHRTLPTLRVVEGRRTDMLRRADGGLAHALSVIYALRDEPAVARFRVTQRRNLDLDVLIEPASPGRQPRGLDPRTRHRLEQGLSRRLGGVRVNLYPVTEIPPDPSGKHRCVRSEA